MDNEPLEKQCFSKATLAEGNFVPSANEPFTFKSSDLKSEMLLNNSGKARIDNEPLEKQRFSKATLAEGNFVPSANEPEFFIDNLLKDKNTNDMIDFTEIDKIVEEILKNNTIKENNNMFNKIQVKTVEHKPTKMKECIVS